MILSYACKIDPDSRIRDNKAMERSDDCLEVEDKEEDGAGAGTNGKERKFLDEFEGLEEAEEEEYSGPLFAEGDEDDEYEYTRELEGLGKKEVYKIGLECEAELETGPDFGHRQDIEAEAEAEIREDNGDRYMGNSDVLDFLTEGQELDEGTPEEQAEFSRELAHFFASRKMGYRPPKFYGQNLNLLKLWRTVIRLGAYDYVTTNKLWRYVGVAFNPPKKCTTVSWSFRVFYEKSLLEYERYKLHGTVHCSSGQEGNEDLMEDPNPANKDGLLTQNRLEGRTRRDAAVRAMQGWHSQNMIDAEEGELSNEASTVVTPKRKKEIRMGTRKRKDPLNSKRVRRTAQLMNGTRNNFVASPTQKTEYNDYSFQPLTGTPKKQSSKQGHTNDGFSYHLANGVDLEITDEGPVADWVKINVQKAGDCFEVYVLVPGLLQEELRILCEPGGMLMIIGEPEKPNNPWGITPFRKVIKLPLPIDADQTCAVITLHGQLFIRVPYFEQ